MNPENFAHMVPTVRDRLPAGLRKRALPLLLLAVVAAAPLTPVQIFDRARTVWRQRLISPSVTFVGEVAVVRNGNVVSRCAQRVSLRTRDDRGSTTNALAGREPCGVADARDALLYGPDDSPLGFYVSGRSYGAQPAALARDPFGTRSAPTSGLRVLATVRAVAEYYKIELAGVEDYDGHRVYHLVLRPLGDPQEYPLRALWVDATTFQTWHLTYAAYWNHDTVDYYFAPVGPHAVWYIDRIVTHESGRCGLFAHCSTDTTEQLHGIEFYER